jgi:hypothetical protein
MSKKRTDRDKPANPRNVNRHKQPRLAFHLPQELFDAFNSYMASLAPQPAESAVLRHALEQYLAQAGFWPAPKPSDKN